MSGARFVISRHAFAQLIDIEDQSTRRWGETVAQQYIHDLYASFEHVVAEPTQLALPRLHRSTPFMMVAARSHFVIYDLLSDSTVVILGIEHRSRDIENLIPALVDIYQQEISDLRRQSFHDPEQDE